MWINALCLGSKAASINLHGAHAYGLEKVLSNYFESQDLPIQSD